MLLPALALALLAGSQEVVEGDADRDGDGLSDFHEVHKYCTDPDRADTDGDGAEDGKWHERREYTYSVRTRLRVVAPAEADTDDQQDARVLARGEGWVELEVVHYPLSTAHAEIPAAADWRQHTAGLAPWLASTVTSRFDDEMREGVRTELAARGIDAASADDRTLAVETARMLLERATYEDGFTTFLCDFDGERAIVPAALRSHARARERKAGRSIQQVWQRELFADGMYRNRVRGSCTSTAIYLCGGLRAAGVPARLVLAVPLADANDPQQVALVERGIRHHRVRETVLAALRPLAGSWTSHTFDEVFVGGRWRRLDGARLGPPPLDEQLFGLSTRVLTLRDWADARMGLTVGRRQELGERDERFATANPYALLAVDDSFGIHARIANPPVEERPPLEAIELVDSFWLASERRPHYLRVSGVDMATDRHHVLLSARIAREDIEKARLDAFWDAVPKAFELVPDGGETLAAWAIRGFWCGVDDGSPYLYFLLQLPDEARKRMRAGTRYALVPAARDGGPRFRAAGLAITAE